MTPNCGGKINLEEKNLNNTAQHIMIEDNFADDNSSDTLHNDGLNLDLS